MAITKRTKKCDFKSCKKNAALKQRFCYGHVNKVTIDKFLSRAYSWMNSRTRGKNTRRPDLYLGLPILPKDVFINWAKNHPEFLKLYKRWFSNNFDRRLTPTVNRMNPSKGYTLDNIEWMTNSQNCGLSSVVQSMKKKKAIYDLLGMSK